MLVSPSQPRLNVTRCMGLGSMHGRVSVRKAKFNYTSHRLLCLLELTHRN